MANSPTNIINSDIWFYLYERWQDESEYEDFDDYKKKIEELFDVKVVEAKDEPWIWLIEYRDGERFEIGIKEIESDETIVSMYRKA